MTIFKLGVDEAGRGPLAGPVVAACFCWVDPEFKLTGITDSKKLKEHQRNSFYKQIVAGEVEKSCFAAFSSVDHKVIDQINILQANHRAMTEACDKVMKKLIDSGIASLEKDTFEVYIDGNRIPPQLEKDTRYSKVEAIIGGNSKVADISAASVYAKVIRDQYMVEELHPQYPQYRFDRHKGYGSKVHFAALDRHGLSPVHRRSFLKKYLARKQRAKHHPEQVDVVDLEEKEETCPKRKRIRR